MKIKLHRPIEGKIKTCTIKREGEHWYVTCVCEVEEASRKPYTDDIVGIDLGVCKLATLSTGDVIENPRPYRRAEKKLAAAQQALARKKRGSNRRKKAVKDVARLHRKTRNQRADYLHKHSRWLVDTYETIVFEDIAPAHLSKRAKPKQDEDGKYLPNGASQKSGLNKSIVDAGWSQFIALCEYKAACAGFTQVIKVDPKYTSQVCSSCGAVKKKELSERWHSCECGCELDRDHNAALNIKNRWLGRSLQLASAS
jgi:putative transposase